MPWAGNSIQPLNYMAVTCTVPAEAVEETVQIFLSWTGAGVEWDDGSPAQAPYTDIPLAPGEPFVRAYFPLDASWPSNQARIAAEARSKGWEVSYREILTEDWENSWKQYYQPISLPEGYQIVPAWSDAVTDDSRHQIVLDPAMAFGTGDHPTTLMCLEQIIRVAPVGQRVLDLGAGSGILAILAARMGAKRVVAVEPDPVAFRALKENVDRNAVAATLILGTLADVPHREVFDLALLNLIADIIIPEWPHLVPYLAQGAQSILSGILSERTDEVAQVVRQSGFQVQSVQHRQGWAMMVVRR
ncbi:50S ribosomal protein L11 methyltransferase [Sulfobacillus sp. hq2]|uniref:Ribosomal protein L11 methyltransferase n=1 Tax=Sulfobacillus thermotolerans TaxID=338644 RepID=A0ABM6RPC9_9FIRM|nr:50S ribosomal protein L11 methyltransferase [Sulfobacillus sp. hq2]AUW93207.1 hypothetical protein BXT84_03935 [Sulfobacillus thermotolerans]POB11716.1 50S ribosomal protein L11 methyltransferase [Sulfobacillus sp. hq2]